MVDFHGVDSGISRNSITMKFRHTMEDFHGGHFLRILRGFQMPGPIAPLLHERHLGGGSRTSQLSGPIDGFEK